MQRSDGRRNCQFDLGIAHGRTRRMAAQNLTGMLATTAVFEAMGDVEFEINSLYGYANNSSG
jgi:hypothetical protein